MAGGGQKRPGDAGGDGHTKDAVYWHLKSIYKKLPVSRQADLVRLVLSVADLG